MKKYDKMFDQIQALCAEAETFTDVERGLGTTTPNCYLRNYIKAKLIPMPKYKGVNCGNKRSQDTRKKVDLSACTVGCGVNRRSLKRFLFKEGLKEERCEVCGWCERRPLDGLMPLHLHHVNGCSTDNRIENLQLLCPNCHALTENYAGKNKKKAR